MTEYRVGQESPVARGKAREKLASRPKGTLQPGVGARGARIDTPNYKEVPFGPDSYILIHAPAETVRSGGTGVPPVQAERPAGRRSHRTVSAGLCMRGSFTTAHGISGSRRTLSASFFHPKRLANSASDRVWSIVDFDGFSVWKGLLMRIPAVLGGSANGCGRMSATTMPSSPPGTAGRR